MKPKILLVDRQRLFRESLGQILQNQADIAGLEDMSQVQDMVSDPKLRPNLILTETFMPGLSPIEVTRRILKLGFNVRVAFLSDTEDEEVISQAVELGVSYISKTEVGISQMSSIVNDLLQGRYYFGQTALSRLVDVFKGRTAVRADDPLKILTPKEREVIKLLAEGGSVKEIATNLDVSVKTVEAHKFNLMRKLNIHNKAQLVAYAVRRKIINVDAISLGGSDEVPNALRLHI